MVLALSPSGLEVNPHSTCLHRHGFVQRVSSVGHAVGAVIVDWSIRIDTHVASGRGTSYEAVGLLAANCSDGTALIPATRNLQPGLDAWTNGSTAASEYSDIGFAAFNVTCATADCCCMCAFAFHDDAGSLNSPA